MPGGGTEEGSIVGENLCHCGAFRIKVVFPHSVAPPIGEGHAAEPEGECRDDNAQRGADVEGTGQDIVVSSCC